jgi:hypothetical protein
MDQFPQMIYKAPGREQIHGGSFDTTIVENAEALDAALAEGWHVGTDEAKAAHLASLAQAQLAEPPAANAPPTRAELEQKATELGIVFAANIGDKKLAERIAEKLAEPPAA